MTDMRAPPRLRSERLERWVDRLLEVRGLFAEDRVAIAELRAEMHEAWRDELATEVRSETTCAHGFVNCEDCRRPCAECGRS